jgi:hypothetical protein
VIAGLLAEAGVGRLERFDALLAAYRPFGDSDYIHEQLHASYRRRLRAVSDVLPSAGRLADAVSGLAPDIRYRVLGDTVVRCATQHAFRQVKTGAPYGLPYDICGEVFESAIQQIDRGATCGPLQATVPQVAFIGTHPRYGWVWTEDHPNDVFGAAFRALIRENYGELLATSSEAETAMLREGVSLLEELVPQVTGSTLTHAHIVGLFPPTGNWARRASGSQFRLGGTIFLNRETLQNPWWVAEHILHESLHQKLYDFRHAHSLLAQDVLTVEQQLQLETDDSAAVWVLSPWNTPGMAQLNRWDTHRVIAAFHVYVHLSLMSSIAEGTAPSLEKRYGPINDRPATMTNPRTAFDRAHYLAQSLATTCWGELGAAGQLLVRWLTGVLADMDPAPPPKNAIVHLLLDRYLREARVVERDRGQKALAEVVDGLCQRELATTCRILAVLGRAGAIDQFEDAARELRDRHDVAGFSLVRQLIAQQLMGASSDKYTLSSVRSSRANADDMVQEMVEESSRVLATAAAVG